MVSRRVGVKQIKVHLVGHSMGGQTIRTLVQILKEGSYEEKIM